MTSVTSPRMTAEEDLPTGRQFLPERDPDPADDQRSTLPGWLLDALTEAVIIAPTDAAVRAAVLCEVVEELCVAIGWLNDTQDPVSEQRGAYALLQAARFHRRRMAAAADDHSEHGAYADRNDNQPVEGRRRQ